MTADEVRNAILQDHTVYDPGYGSYYWVCGSDPIRISINQNISRYDDIRIREVPWSEFYLGHLLGGDWSDAEVWRCD